MAQQGLIDSRVSLKQCKLAVHALHAHQSKKEQELQESELLPGKEQNIWLNVTVKKMPSGHKFKPVKIAIAHPLVDPRTTPVCLITKDPQREYKDLLESHKIKFISRVVGIEKLKGKFKPFEARRMLLKENGLFLADERVVPLLPKLLGVKWFQAKKQPIPVCLKRKDLKGELERAISSTYMNQNKGTCTSIKIGTLSQKPDHILANLELALPAIAKNIHGGWDNIQALHIKTNSSTSLPIWSCSLDDTEGGRWDGLNVMSDEARDTSSEDDDDDAKVEHDEDETRKEAVHNKGKKRGQSEDTSGKPRKKVKGAQDKIVAPSAVSATSSKPAKPASSIIDTPPKSGKRKIYTTELPVATPSVDDPTESPSTKRVRELAKSTSTLETKLTSGKAKREKKKDDDRMDTSLSVPASKRGISSAVQVSNTKQEMSKSIRDTSMKKKAKMDVSTGSITTPLEDVSADIPKEKREKRKSTVDTGTAASTPLTKAELRQKRSSEVGSKKKDKVKAMGGKSAKNSVLGKKVAQ